MRPAPHRQHLVSVCGSGELRVIPFWQARIRNLALQGCERSRQAERAPLAARMGRPGLHIHSQLVDGNWNHLCYHTVPDVDPNVTQCLMCAPSLVLQIQGDPNYVSPEAFNQFSSEAIQLMTSGIVVFPLKMCALPPGTTKDGTSCLSKHEAAQQPYTCCIHMCIHTRTAYTHCRHIHSVENV